MIEIGDSVFVLGEPYEIYSGTVVAIGPVYTTLHREFYGDFQTWKNERIRKGVANIRPGHTQADLWLELQGPKRG